MPQLWICDRKPAPPSGSFKAFNNEWFSREASENVDEQKRWDTFWARISPHFKPSSVLDVGSRHGRALVYLTEKIPSIKLAAVELVPEFQEKLRHEIGATVFTYDLEKPWPDEMHGKFDLIIFRHTLEHLECPLIALQNLAQALTPSGLLYIAVPNSLNMKIGHPIRTDYFRPVHCHYFNRGTLIRLAARAKLYPRICEAEGEVWGLFSADHKFADTVSATYSEQRDVLDRCLSASRIKDFWAMAKILIRRVLRHKL